MDRWNDYAFLCVVEMSRKDEHYQTLLMRLNKIEPLFCQIINALPETERSVVEEYVTLCEEMQYRKAQLAFELGAIENNKPGH